MFNPKTQKIDNLAKKYSLRIEELKKIFDKSTNVYIDFANVIKWQDKLKWRISLKRLKQLLTSFSTINDIKFYYGTLAGSVHSENIIREVEKYKYSLRTKPVKKINLSIDISSIPLNSPQIIRQFISPILLKKLDIETIEYLNSKLKELNEKGITYLIKHKCNFDVEISVEMLLDNVDNYILWSGDSDFADPVKTLLDKGKKVGIFSISSKVSVELNELRKEGLFIFDIRKIRDFICWQQDI